MSATPPTLDADVAALVEWLNSALRRNDRMRRNSFNDIVIKSQGVICGELSAHLSTVTRMAETIARLEATQSDHQTEIQRLREGKNNP